MQPAVPRPCLPAPVATLLGFTALAVVALLTSGCAASGSPDYDSRFGDASRALRAQQFIDEQAPRSNAGITPPTDGRSLRQVADRHVDSFKAPPATNIINIGVGGGGGGN